MVYGVQEAATHFELTPADIERLKAQYGSILKKKDLMGQTFVFRVVSRRMWEDDIETWRKSMSDSNKEFTVDDVDKKLIETAVVFPSLNYEFENPGHELLFWNNQPAGVQPRLARQIEHHAGYIVADLVKGDEAYAENLFTVEKKPRPSEEEIELAKDKTDLPLKLVGLGDEWYIIRAAKHTEFKATTKAFQENRAGDHDLQLLKRCILLGDTEFDNKPAGLVTILLNHLQQVSGLGDEDIFSEVAEDL